MRLIRRRGGYAAGVLTGKSLLRRRLAVAAVVLGALALGAYALASSTGSEPAREPVPPATPAPAAASAAGGADGAYVALGDSYSSGIGAGSYIPSAGPCLRSRRSYASRLGRTVSSFRACGGATTADVLDLQLAPFPQDTRLVTITIGGNDAGFADVLETCLFGSAAACSARVGRAERFVRRVLPQRLRRVYDAIRERAPQATVVVAGYPRLFARRPWCGRAGLIDEREQRRLNEGANLLARTIAAEAARHRGFRFADVRPAFNGHGICSPSPRIHGIASRRVDSFHPTARGYETYARVIRRRL